MMRILFILLAVVLGGLVGYVFSNYFGLGLGMLLGAPISLLLGFGCGYIGQELDD